MRDLVSACGWVVVLSLSLLSCAQPGKKVVPAATPQAHRGSEHVARGKNWVVAAQGLGAAQAAHQMFELGGNVIDAAVAASYAISVERPHSTGLGGGGFLIYREAKTGQIFVADFRERAPLQARADLFLDSAGEPVAARSLDGALSVATPGVVAGLEAVHRKWGRLKRTQVVAPAIRLAEEGIEVYPSLAGAIQERQSLLSSDPDARRIFLKPDGTPYQVGEKLLQVDLGKSLRLISKEGARAFYRGKIAQAILRTTRERGGILQYADLARYQVKWRKPVASRYKQYEVFSMPPPSSGGTHVIQILNLVEQEPLARWGYLSTRSIHATASAMQQAFADRAAYMGDPDFVKVPVEILTSKKYAREQRALMPLSRARSASEVGPGKVVPESPETTHFSIMDAEGNVVVSTQTINYYFGSGVVAGGTGIVLNDEMDDFAAKAGASNVFGAVGSDANAIAPLKTPLSSMSPTLVMRDGTPVLALGAPGGTRILTCVAQTILNRLEYGLDLADSIASIRFHHQWKPDKIRIDAPGPGEGTVSELRKMGYTVEVEPKAVGCIVNAVAREGGDLVGAADPRDAGAALAK